MAPASGGGERGRWTRRVARLLPVALLGVLVGGLALLTRPPPTSPPGPSPAASVPPAAPGGIPTPTRPRPTPPALYRWRNDEGRLHLSSEPPPAGVMPEVIPLAAPPDGGAAPALSAPGPSSSGALAADPIAVYTPDGLRELAQRLATTRRHLEDRDRILEELQRELRP